jgi:4-hydroxybenzoate polyprenyltransferase
MAGERAFFIFAITIPFDIRDLALDQGAKVDTLPGIWGIKSAKKIALTALLLMLFFVIYNAVQGTYTMGNTLALLLSVAISAVLILGSNPQRHDYYYTGLLDGTMIMQALLVVFLG